VLAVCAAPDVVGSIVVLTGAFSLFGRPRQIAHAGQRVHFARILLVNRLLMPPKHPVAPAFERAAAATGFTHGRIGLLHVRLRL